MKGLFIIVLISYNNISNQDTPGYKRQDVDFQSALKTALQTSGYQTMDGKVGHVRTSALEVSAYTDSCPK